MGAYLCAGGARRQAADLLNLSSYPAEDILVTPENIRDGVNRFSWDMTKWHVLRRPPEHWDTVSFGKIAEATALCLAYDFRATTTLWRSLCAAKGRNPIDRYVLKLIRNGEFFSFWNRAAEATTVSRDEQRSYADRLLHLMLQRALEYAAQKHGANLAPAS
jgi:hypothetical protein